MFTIGYASKPIKDYLQQLETHAVDVVVDVRSVPYSRAFFDYHQPALREHLRTAGLRYLDLGPALGPRSPDPAHYDSSGQVQFGRLMQAPAFREGITRLLDGMAKGYRIALNCACKDPATCHRALLVGWFLYHEQGIELQHLRHEGELEGQSALEQRLLSLTGTVPDMLTPEADALRLAYQRQCVACAWCRP